MGEDDEAGCALILDDVVGSETARLVGELDLFNAPELGRILDPLLRRPAAVLDLSGVTFIDVAGARALLSLVGASDGVRVVAPPSSPCDRLLSLVASTTPPAGRAVCEAP